VPPKVKTSIANLALTIASTLICYLILEVAFFRVALPRLPFNIRTHLPDVADVLVQNSKRGHLPHGYIALLGDSYADGVGDWLLAGNGDRAKPFHSANVIHELTGRDVVSFGKGPAGSAEGLVLRPARIFANSSCWLFPSIENPTQILYYFYEGNDIEDNLLFLKDVFAAYGRADAGAIENYLRESYASASSWRCHRHLADTLFRMGTFAFQYHFQNKDIRRAVAYNSNTLAIAGRSYQAAPLQGPALGLSATEIEAGLAVFAPSLAWLRQRLPDVPVTVVYIPSPLSVYSHAMPETIGTWRAPRSFVLAVADRAGTSAAALADAASDLLCNHMRVMSLSQGAGFVDTRPTLRKAAAAQPIHGPVDWAHLNERGYRALGELLVQRLEQGNPTESCAARY
jgi:hypothetical protein